MVPKKSYAEADNSIGGGFMFTALTEQSKVRKQVIEFKGYNHNSSIGDGEFYDMQNLSPDYYPVLSPRKPRGTVSQLITPNGLMHKNYLVYVDGTNLYYNGVIKGQVTDSKKQLVSMGAYILIFPDKKYYNTATDTFGSLEASFTTTGTVTVQGSTLDGTYADTATSLYAKITCTGIGANFKQYDGITISGSISVLNKTVVIQAIGTDYIVVAGKIGADTSHVGITVSRAVPDMNFITESENHIWGCSSIKHEIYSCKLGDPFNWNCYEGISTDSYTVTVGSDGEFTGAITYLGYVLFFKEDCIHKIYGSKPSNYQVMTSTCRGVMKGCEKSLAIVNETLYYMSCNGIVAYEGSIPESISHPFGDIKYTDGVAGSIGDKYYISMKNGSTYHLFVFDEKVGLWYREDNTNAIYFTTLDDKLYYIDGNTKKLMTIEGSDSETIQWYAYFSDFQEKDMNKKYVSKVQFRLELEKDSIFEAYIMYENSGIWNKITTIEGKMKRSVNAAIPIRRCDYYVIKLSGAGPCKLYSMVKTYTEGSDL